MTDRVAERLERLELFVLNSGLGVNPSGGGSIASLDLSPDGRRLYILINTGRGSGVQSGFVAAMDVDLYKDENPATPALESSPWDYLKLRPELGIQSVTRPASDEPSDLAVRPNGRELYVVNDGATAFSPAGMDPTVVTDFAVNVVLDASGNVITDPNLSVQLAQQLLDGAVIAHAPGVIDVFGVPALGAASLRYQSDVNYGWTPSAANGGLVLSPVRFGAVFSKLPTSIAIRSDGNRALVSVQPHRELRPPRRPAAGAIPQPAGASGT